MTEGHDPHARESTVESHGAAGDHGDSDGHDDDAHAAAALGPIDVPAWGAAAAGIALGLVVVLAFIQALV